MKHKRRGHPLAIPTAIAVATGAGLLIGLLGEGAWDAFAAAALAVPLLAIVFAWTRA